MKVVQNVIMIVDSRQQQSFFKEVNGDDNVENGEDEYENVNGK